ncbi:unnamed protein product [Linum trigynum]|uniref:Helitron helicase-like domain-containing protein n=1 Tax=Linum trigynum TaxID=586398 RepID=A0AAV2G1V3_9ROSI
MPPRKRKQQSKPLISNRLRSSVPEQIFPQQSPPASLYEYDQPSASNCLTRTPPRKFPVPSSKSVPAFMNLDQPPRDPYIDPSIEQVGVAGASNGRRQIPTARMPLHDDILNIGKPECVCAFCGAMFWPLERLDRRRPTNNPVYTLCCQKGRVSLPLLQQPPPLLADLLRLGGSPMSKHFKDNIRPYNGALCFTSFGASIDPRSLLSGGPCSMVICGENDHRIGSLLPPDGEKPKFDQLYVFEPENEIDHRLSNLASRDSQLLPEFLTALLQMLDQHNVLVKTFRRVRQHLQDSNAPHMKLRIFRAKSINRQYDLPTSADVAMLNPGDFIPDRDDRDIIVDHIYEGLKRITSLNPKFDALHFPLLFPYGEDGYHPLIKYNQSRGPHSMRRQCVTQREYYAFRLQYRQHEGRTLVQAGKALQHYCIYAFSSVELNRLEFLRCHQPELRAEVYQGLQDAMARGDLDGDKVRHVVLPGTYIGNPRNMQQLYHDAMAVVEFYGNPDLFITFMCNSLWEEMSQAFDAMVGTNSADKPMVVARIFHIKLYILIDDIKRENYYGKTIAIMYTVEYEKRGLPNIHLLVWLEEPDKLRTTADVDAIISAEIPDPELDPVGYEAVVKYMLHGPCGDSNKNAPCMRDKKCSKVGKCSKHIPKEFNSATTFDKSSCVAYKRSDSGIQVQKGSAFLDNRHVVPYNRNLLVRMQAYINVEVCHKGKLIKYLFKYVTKGPDISLVIAEDSVAPHNNPLTQTARRRDEIQQFIDCRSLSSYEAIWRLNEYPIQVRKPSVVRLGVHLDGQQKVSYKKQSNVRNVLGNPNAGKTHLTEWFALNRRDPEARKLTYSQIPNKYTWLADCKEWDTCKRGFAIGRVAYVSPSSGDVFFLRIMLSKVRGALSYTLLRTVAGEVCPDFEKACDRLGLPSDSSEWIRVFNEIASSSMPRTIRSTFVSMLMFCEISSPIALFNAAWRLMVDDYAYTISGNRQSRDQNPTDERLQNWVLRQLQQLLGSHSSTLQDFNLPIPNNDVVDDGTNSLINDHLNFDVEEQQHLLENMVHSLNMEKLHVYSSMVSSMHNNKMMSLLIRPWRNGNDISLQRNNSQAKEFIKDSCFGCFIRNCSNSIA